MKRPGKTIRRDQNRARRRAAADQRFRAYRRGMNRSGLVRAQGAGDSADYDPLEKYEPAPFTGLPIRKVR